MRIVNEVRCALGDRWYWPGLIDGAVDRLAIGFCTVVASVFFFLPGFAYRVSPHRVGCAVRFDSSSFLNGFHLKRQSRF